MANVRRSKKRDSMLDLLRSTKCHPSAEWVYQQLRTTYPELSLGTVYRNLSQLAEQGLIRRLGVFDGQERYDGDTGPHAHFVCNRCGAILDLPGSAAEEERAAAASVQYGFSVQSCELIVRGLCRDCQEIETTGGNLS